VSYVLDVIGVVLLVAVVVWVLTLPGDDDPEAPLGFIAANWRRFRR
jgi:hypothetical protein